MQDWSRLVYCSSSIGCNHTARIILDHEHRIYLIVTKSYNVSFSNPEPENKYKAIRWSVEAVCS